jgi:hypothetical protein
MPQPAPVEQRVRQSGWAQPAASNNEQEIATRTILAMMTNKEELRADCSFLFLIV